MLAAFGLPKEIVDKGYIPRKGSIAEWVIERAEPLILNERAQGREFNALDDKRKIVSSMCVPLQAPRGILGTINLNRTDPSISTFGQPELDAMTILASQASIYIEYSRLHEANLKSERLAAIGQTVAGISHCIKNLVTGMKGGVSLCKMARDHQDWEIHDQAMEVLGHSVKRVSDLVMDMLEYSKDREPDLGDVDLEALLLEIRGVTRAKAEKLKVEVEIKLSEEARRIRADGHKLFRCLLNLMENGLDAAGIDGRVTVSAERSRSESALKRLSTPARAAIVIRVADSGPGIDPEHRAQIFEPFFSTKGSKGTGLGLAVTQKIIREHGGELELESKPGGSAVFAIHLPAGDEISTNHSDE
jgi:signal transduction histidine kinase